MPFYKHSTLAELGLAIWGARAGPESTNANGSKCDGAASICSLKYFG